MRSTTGCCPSNLQLAETELMLGGKMGRELTLKRALRDLKKQHDAILLDCPPSLGLLTVNALVAADCALMSSEAEYFSLQGVEQALVGRRAGARLAQPRPRVAGRRAEHRRHARSCTPARRSSSCARASATRSSRRVIRRSVRYAESAERGRSIIDHAPGARRRLPRARRRGAGAPRRPRRRAQAAGLAARRADTRLAPFGSGLARWPRPAPRACPLRRVRSR